MLKALAKAFILKSTSFKKVHWFSLFQNVYVIFRMNIHISLLGTMTKIFLFLFIYMAMYKTYVLFVLFELISILKLG